MDKNNTLFKENTSFSDFVALNQPICSKTQKEAFKRRRSSSTSSVETLRDMYQNDQQNRQQNRQQSISKLQNNDNTPPSIFESFPYTLYVDNRDSAARDHMANERTYLAWVRTSLSTVSIGVALTQIFRFDKNLLQNPEAAEELQAIGTPLGIAFIIIGISYSVFACIRYFHSQEALTKGYFPASRGIVLFASASIFIALVSVFIVISKKH